MLDLMPALAARRPAAAGERCAVATVVGAGGSVPRPVGTSMLVSESSDVLGSLSGGCVEGAVVAAAFEVMADGGPRREFFGYSAEDAFAVGLTCGGEPEIHIELLPDAGGGLRLDSLQALDAHDPAAGLALIRRLDDHSRAGSGSPGGAGAVITPDPGSYQVAQSGAVAAMLGVAGDGEHPLLLAAAAQLEPLLRGGRTGLVRLATPEGCLAGTAVPQNARTRPGPITLLVESRLPAARMLVFGANDFGAALLPAARLLGYHVTLCDARPAFASQSRFAGADQVVTAWPHRYLAAEAAAGRVDARTVVCVFTHDPKFDIPLLQTALGLDLAYVGALGSRRSHVQRVDLLLAAGVTAVDLSRLHSPIGLDLGAVTPAEVAVSITAELVASRTRSARGLSLKHGSGPIHQRAGQGSTAAPPAGTLPVRTLPARTPQARTPQNQEMPWT
ncbi:XdhC family protein [Arthrobacter sp. PsM3]|uniref:XdhC family protein n=1 Tax=Arthrobacter sp. PsM3 TaxID=3030531 RepID=UPI00263A5775|nr:XdhC/CoxI family protein [Arthrobacter sp. PsM3]MDN4645293.1 XdhC family protein [Arthrobacter sp. PsM3]